MLDLNFARDLVVTATIFGAAAFAWAGWAQERPPVGIRWRVVLVALQVAGLVLLSFGIVAAVQHWETPTAIDPGSVAFVWYVAIFWLEVIATVGLAILFARTKRAFLIAPSLLILVGVHFVPLAFVFGQPIIMLAAVLLIAAGIAALFLPGRVAPPSFWSGILASPVLLVLGAVALVAGIGALNA